MTSYTPEVQLKKKVQLGWAILVLCFIFLFMFASFGIISAFKTGELFSYLFFGWLVLATVIGFILKSRNSLIKANGRIVANIVVLLACLGLAGNSYRDDQKLKEAKNQLIEQVLLSNNEVQRQSVPNATATEIPVSQSTSNNSADKLVSLIGKMKYHIKRLGDDMTGLGQKINSLDTSNLLKPQRLTTKEGIQTSRQEVATLRSMIDERQAILQQYFTDVENLIKTSDISEVDRASTLDGFNKGKTNTAKLYGSLKDVQVQSIKATTDILDFAENILGSTVVQDGKIMFQTQTELDEYNRLMGLLKAKASQEESITQQIMEKMQSSRQKMVSEYQK